jgi:tRNA-dihydrouridine synthase 3
MGWKCRFIGTHMAERDTDDGRKELVLLEDPNRNQCKSGSTEDEDTGIVNSVSTQTKLDLQRKRFDDSKAETYVKWLNKVGDMSMSTQNKSSSHDDKQELRALYQEAPFLASEKRRIYFGPETPVLAPLTTQGNLPFRRLCVGLGAQLTYSEMAMVAPLVQGQKSEWALMRAHESEMVPPNFTPQPGKFVVKDYDNTGDIKFGAQVAANKPFFATKAVQAMAAFLPNLRVIDLNCGCPIDLVFKQGAGSALLDNNSKLDKIIRGMNAVSGNIPITAKIRTGTKDNKPTAVKTIDRLVYGDQRGDDGFSTPCGVAAITLHGRSRQQRYTKSANWEYISECAALIKQHRKNGDDLADTVREADSRYNPANGQVYFLGNGDCYSHVDYYDHVQNAGVDSVMVARGALIKPWIFEEIEKGQYLDKSATERLAYVEKYARYGLETWGSDEMGIGLTRRFLLEWLSFSYRYVPEGILEHLPPNIQDRPPAWRGRNDLETLMGSDNYLDWIKIRYVRHTLGNVLS